MTTLSAGGRDRLRFGIFMPTVSNSPNISHYKADQADWTFAANRAIGLAAEEVGFDFLFPVSRWRTIGGDIDYHGKSLETMTWAAAMLASTSRIQIFSTVHVPAFNPVVAAKMGASLDHIGNGRWGINIVSGWNRSEFDMMGIEMLEHGKRYQRSEDFIKILKGLWTAPPGSFNFESEHYTVRGGYVMPQPSARPHPTIVNAGTSNDAREMVARQCDWAFVCPVSMDDAQDLAADFKARAQGYGRSVRLVCMVLPVWAATRAEAEAERARVVEQMDAVAVRNWADGVGLESGSFSQQTLETFAFGAGSLPLLGTADEVAEQIAELYRRGMDGVLMSYMDYLGDTRRFGQDIVPRLRAMGVV
ncbi:MAG: LLM class flavin-dependent oxidoreductase [Gammaproteobacteria bacterium]|nr:LLM class flavin-dependent oxidoreductase [Gammaproteobacteria bacterium]